jgi:hypothetical protein
MRCGRPFGRPPQYSWQSRLEKGCVEAKRLSKSGRVVRGEPGGPYWQSVKEVIQPQVPLRLPCYDFAPVTALAFGG